jgi:hypothetical protein
LALFNLQQFFDSDLLYLTQQLLSNNWPYLLWKQDDDLPGKEMDETLGTFTAPLATLRQGDFKLPLYDRKGRVRPHRWVKVNCGAWVCE